MPRTTPNSDNKPDHNSENDAEPQRRRTPKTSKEANDAEPEPNHNTGNNTEPQ